MPVVFVMVIVFWMAGADRPSPPHADLFDTAEECDTAAITLTRAWESAHPGGSASWACEGAYPAPTT